jgi:hypothetical protein
VSRRLLAVSGATAVAVATAVTLASLLFGDESRRDDPIPRRLQADGTLAPRIVLFGDTVRAHVDVTLDRRRVDPDSVKVRASFKEWRHVGPAQVDRSDAGSTTYLRVEYVIRCLKQNCPPQRDLRPFEFDPATVSYTDRSDGTPEQESVEVFWPRLIVNTRIGPGDLAIAGRPWRADVATVPAPSYRASPRLLVSALAAAALALALAGIALTWLGWPRRQPEPLPAVPPEPEFLLTPLEQALELLEDAARANGAADQRRSLELVAEVLAQRGDEDGLAPAARELAWSPVPPPPEASKDLAIRVRAKLDEELRKLDAQRRQREAEAAAAVAAAEEARARRT